MLASGKLIRFPDRPASFCILGALFGFLFPVFGTLILIYEGEFPLSFEVICQLHGENPLLKIIDTAPFWLGLFAYFIGKHLGESEMLIQQLQETSEQRLQLMNEATQANLAKSQFLANMSHEIRTPLNGILGMNHLIKTTELSAEQREYVKSIEVCSENLHDLISNILDLSKIEAGRMALEHVEFDLHLLVENLALAFSGEVNSRQIELLVDIDCQAPKMVFGDPLRLRQILANFLSNAFKFTDTGQILLSVGSFEIGAEEQREGRVTRTFNFSVSDTGIGMNAVECKKVFEAFTQADGSTTRKYGGTGLGLTISQNFVKLMHGQIGVESEEGKGATFWVTIPLEIADAGHMEKHLNQEELKDLKVLVVDDNLTNRIILIKLLKRMGIHCTPVSDGKEALAILENESHTKDDGFDLIIMDQMMPGLSGLQTCQQIRLMLKEHTPRMVLLSSGADFSDAVTLEQAGIQRAIRKPIRFDDLKEIISNAPVVCESVRNASTEPALLESRAGMRVLVAEDNAVNKKVIERMLRREGLDVDVVSDGEQAVQMARERRYQLIFMDIQMPVMDGKTAAKEIQKMESALDQKTPIIALTAHALAGDREAYLRFGMSDYLSKPIRVDELKRVLRTYCSSAIDASV